MRHGQELTGKLWSNVRTKAALADMQAQYPRAERDATHTALQHHTAASTAATAARAMAPSGPSGTRILAVVFVLTLGPVLVDNAPQALRCAQVERTASPVFQLVRRCSRSAMAVVAQANVSSIGRCADLAASRRGLAFNYGPRGAPRSVSSAHASSCLVLDCPEFEDLSSLLRDEAYDYYSLFTDPVPLKNWSCVPGVGMFRVRGQADAERANHSVAADRCIEDSGALAHVLSEARTEGLAALLDRKGVDAKNRTVGPVNRAFVDLDDVAQDGLFLTSANEPLECFPYRAWSPGEPRSRSASDACVVLRRRRAGASGAGAWAVTDCAKRLPYICELLPGRGGDCDQDDDGTRETCLEMRRLRGSPDDRCEGWDALTVSPSPPTTAAPTTTAEYGEEDEAEGGGDQDEDKRLARRRKRSNE